ncbi:hypothetical protein P40081_15270 [Paenibacillus sp. FSL P4-0081]|uniref:hypothetical protein n=1 Tax=Paenibacillus sp. FSL P4-0081 TaxID=1536769 RepID=UPI0004F6569E|nr:hypothetical protein [Paenibacillus sp. FSL P4-0081]AIQ29357.1 hypothetical protein P40081_15270 [Paenibacillus sp. FSL P4-0081]
MFSIYNEHILKAFEELNILSQANEIVDIFNRQEKLFIARTIKNEEHKGFLAAIGYMSHLYLQSSLFRSQCYIYGYITSTNTNNVLMTAQSTRAHLEITSSLLFYFFKLKKYIADPTNEDLKNELKITIQKLMAGSKIVITEDREKIEAINVLTMISHADKGILEFGGNNSLMEYYGLLSEFCHPNSYSLVMASNISEDKVIDYNTPFKTINLEVMALFHESIYFTSKLFIDFFEMLKEMLGKAFLIPTVDEIN